jgi:DNA invertase Pin-like site-specific DNA recombinase
MSKKRAVGYCRTSTEGQRDNTSINTQKDEIQRFADHNGYKLTHFYVDESRTGSKIEGREEFQRMMKDAANGLFDVLVVYDITRFSRDGFDIIDSVRTLKREFGVDVVDTKGSFDTRTRDSGRTVVNYVQVGMAEGERLRTLERTKTGKVETAKRNQPIGSKRPFGRIWDKKTKTWSIDPKKLEMAQDVSRRYLAGESMKALAKEYKKDHSNLHRTITERCSDRWVQRVKCKELGIDETIESVVPRLLPEEIIQACRQRAVANKTYFHGQRKNGHSWPLGRMIFCEHCGLALTGCIGGKQRRYYIHSRTKCERSTVRMWVPAEELEHAVFTDLFQCFGNAAAVSRAIEAATPNLDRVDELHSKKTRLEADLSKVKDKRDRLLDFIMDGTVTKSQAQHKMDGLDEREGYLIEQLASVDRELASIPTATDVQETADRLSYQFNTLFATSDFWAESAIINSDFQGMSLEDRRSLAEMVFSGTTADGKRMGVWISWVDGQEATKRKKRWKYRIVGHLSFDRKGFTSTEIPEVDPDEEPLSGGRMQRKLLKKLARDKEGIRRSSYR